MDCKFLVESAEEAGLIENDVLKEIEKYRNEMSLVTYKLCTSFFAYLTSKTPNFHISFQTVSSIINIIYRQQFNILSTLCVMLSYSSQPADIIVDCIDKKNFAVP